MTNFGWWALQVPPGMFLCCTCFEAKDIDEAWMDDQGQRWDTCMACDEDGQRGGQA